VIKGFREFIMRGNVIDLAVAVVIGTAFTAVVTKIVEGVITPLINALGGGGKVGLGGSLRHGSPEIEKATFVDFGSVITAVINFILIAAVVYLILVVPMNKLQERRRRGQVEEPAAPAQDIALLTEIRDLLRTQNTSRS